MKGTQAPTILGEHPVAEFLRDDWQRSARFLKGALKSFRSPISVDEVAGLACENEVESRLVSHTQESPYQLSHGPFGEDRLRELPASGWTLLVQDVDKHVPAVAELLDLVGFLPRWAVDDVMISIAAEGGSVGPHFDQYDVFLVQALGTRRWSLARSYDARKLRHDTDLSVLSAFEPEEEYVAEPGDVLYVPPGVAHYGVAQGVCMTYSFGFRTPSHAELLDIIAQSTDDAGLSRLSISPSPTAARSELGAELLQEIRRAVAAQLSEELVLRRLGEAMTAPKPSLSIAAVSAAAPHGDVPRRLADGEALVRDPATRWLFLDGSVVDGCGAIDPGAGTPSQTGVVLFVNGESYDLQGLEEPRLLAETLCDEPRLDSAALGRWLSTYSMKRLLSTLHGQGYLKFHADL